ncbi:MAG TPA: alpha/beta hydrolase [Frankiaceae bacterium]|jgi:acetyl esterase|nr:alpha/beta hydrolase [Frankiaceae bacterium]
MPLDPTARVLIDAMEKSFPPLDPTISGTEMRARVEAAMATMPHGAAPEPVGEVIDRTVPGPAGEIPVRIYRPAGEPVATIAFFHGGGFVLCDLDSHDGICRALCKAASAVIVAVHYRRAPEARYPAAAEDCYAVTQWASGNLGAGLPLAVFGDSAGGNLAAAVALMARDRGTPSLAAQILVYPMLDSRGDTASHRETGDDYYLRHEEVMYYWGQYVGDPTQLTEPYASPTFADLAGLPPALIATAEFDPLRDEGEAYADALTAAGVRAVKHRYEGMFHSFLTFLGVLPAATELRDEIAAFLHAG